MKHSRLYWVSVIAATVMMLLLASGHAVASEEYRIILNTNDVVETRDTFKLGDRGERTNVECEEAGGEVFESDDGQVMCRFNRASCPSGWSLKNGWRSYSANYCESSPTCQNPCSASGTPFSENATQHSCGYSTGPGPCYARTCYATREDVGCH
ncbi:hypothetical protein TK90_2663 (plasmid) [Thioalkalivibrio sp. K90mix]|uniref:hypothetical protein n=1 Tax=Thioalkalivibrio sp. (strain K90mix) TaxID=396595 RepID=UPI000195A3B3|nr:hypothetical protein [Thioalkalivibrio sp. K90mix]ADC73150.1 hypothetical protein TK90_2663 [Thioalkalivibrio sp. K90mix]